MQKWQGWLLAIFGTLVALGVGGVIGYTISNEGRVSTLEREMADMKSGISTPMAKDTIANFAMVRAQITSIDAGVLEVRRGMEDMRNRQDAVIDRIARVEAILVARKLTREEQRERPPLPAFVPRQPGLVDNPVGG